MTHLIWLMAIAVGLVVVAGLLRLSPDVPRPRVRVRLRRTVILFVPYLLVGLVATYGGRFGSGLWLSVSIIAAYFLAILLTINLAAAFIFDCAPPVVRLQARDLLHDLTVGRTYLVGLLCLMHRSGVTPARLAATS